MISIILIVFFTLSISTSAEWSESWEFEYAEEPTQEPQDNYDPQGFSNYAILNFSGKADTQDNVNPVISGEVPTNTSVAISLSPTCNVTVSDDNGDTMDITFGTNESGSWVYDQTNVSQANGSYQWIFTNADTYDTKYWWKVYCDDGINNVSEVYEFTTQKENQTVSMEGPVPANTASGISINQATWNITIQDPEGDQFNWTIECNNTDTNASNYSTNGSKVLDLTTPLSYSTTFTVWVNATDDNGSATPVSNSYTFTTADETSFSAYSTLSFGGKAETQSEEPTITDQYPTNGSTEVEMYPLLNVTIDEPQDEKFNVTWKTNATGIWTVLQYNDTCTDGTFTYRATFSNASNTQYWWRVEVNDSGGHWTNATYNFTTDTYTWSDWSSWWEFTYTCTSPTSLSANTWNETAINLSWTNSETCDTSVLVRNETGWPHYPNTETNGTVIYNDTGQYFNDTGLHNATTYYYTIWGYNKTENDFSTSNDTASARTQGGLGIQRPYPLNESTGVARPPVNISIGINGTGVNISIYFWNRTPHIETWSLLAEWRDVSEGRYEVLDLDSANGTNEFIWGGTNYNWSVNITDGSDWVNRSYWYNTTGSRYDVDNDNSVFVGDLNIVWANRGGSFDGFYDCDNDGSIFVGDLNVIWANR